MKITIPFNLLFFLTISAFAQETIAIPDVAFEEALIALKYDTNGLNGNILVSDAKYIVNLNIQDALNNKDLRGISSKINDLTGIEEFSNLKRLNCYGNNISKVNLSENSKLTFLNCSQNKITEIDVSNSPDLFFLGCDTNNLTTLKLGDKPKLTEMYANANKLSYLDLKGCSVLETIDVSGNKLKEIIISTTVASKIPEGWYKDEKTVYTTSSGQKAVVKPKLIIEEKSPETKLDLAKTYDESFKKSIAKEFDKALLNEEHIKQKKEELKTKHNLTDEEITKWLKSYSKTIQLKNQID